MKNQPAGEELEFEQELATVERSLHALKERYSQVQHDQQTQAHLQQRQAQIKGQRQRTVTPELTTELKRIQDKLDELEFTLESRLFTWESLKKPFWQVIRFGGAGMIVGWLLAFAVLQSPKPEAPSSGNSPSPHAQP